MDSYGSYSIMDIMTLLWDGLWMILEWDGLWMFMLLFLMDEFMDVQ